jgi:hypothetical protein
MHFSSIPSQTTNLFNVTLSSAYKSLKKRHGATKCSMVALKILWSQVQALLISPAYSVFNLFDKLISIEAPIKIELNKLGF